MCKLKNRKKNNNGINFILSQHFTFYQYGFYSIKYYFIFYSYLRPSLKYFSFFINFKQRFNSSTIYWTI